MSEEEEVAEELVEQEEVEVEVSLEALQEKFSRKDGKALKGGAMFEREEMTFPLSGSECTPGVFEDEDGNIATLELTVVALTHQEELEAQRSIKNPTDMPYTMAKKSLRKYNGKGLNTKAKDFLWEALGPRGRQVVVIAYNDINGAGEEALGKLRSGWRV